jgi:hypothetical protein
MTPIPAERAPLLGVTMSVPGVPDVAKPVQFLDRECGKPLSAMEWGYMKSDVGDGDEQGKQRHSLTSKLAGVPHVLQNPRNMPYDPRRNAQMNLNHNMIDEDNVHDCFVPNPRMISGIAAFEGMYPSPEGAAPKYDRGDAAVKNFISDEVLLTSNQAARYVGAISDYKQWRFHLEEMSKYQTWKPELSGLAPTIRRSPPQTKLNCWLKPHLCHECDTIVGHLSRHMHV